MAARAWVVHPKIDSARLASELDLHPEAASILIRRGLADPREASRFLNPSPDHLESPFVFRDMQKAVDRLRLARERGEKVLVYGDYDVDGVTGSSILCPILRKFGLEADAHIPHRVNEGYGLNRDSLACLLEKGYRLVVTVDNGITGVDQIRFLNERGVDSIVVDHHLPKDGFPAAHAIVSAAVGPGDAHLAACGLAFKLGWALLGSYADVREYLDLVAVGTIADVADVTGENRILLREGMKVLAQAKRPGIRALFDVARIRPGSVTYRDLGFALGPRINAAGRMGSPLDAFRLLTTADPVEAALLAKKLDDGNKERQKVEARTFAEASEIAGNGGRHVIVVESEDWHEGVLGIVASRLVERYKKPSIVISMKGGAGKGSGRSVPAFSLFDSVLECEDLLTAFGGHAQACGLSIRKENVPLFREKLNEVAGKHAERGLGAPDLNIESEISPRDLDLKFLRDLERIEPFGPGNPRPLFMTRGMRAKGEVKKRGKDTLHAWMASSDGRTVCEVVGFRQYERWAATPPAGPVDVVYRPSLVDSQGIVSVQLELEDWK